jgi:hypothetical protein
MLFDPKWQKNDLEYEGVTLSGFIAWLEMQDPNTEYEYINPMICALAQYRKHLGYSGNDLIVDFSPCRGRPSDPGEWLERIVNGRGGHTFGAALERARALQAGRTLD